MKNIKRDKKIGNKKIKSNIKAIEIDKYLLFSVISLFIIGIVMQCSASVAITERIGVPFYFFTFNQLLYTAVGIVLIFLMTCIPLNVHKKLSEVYLLINICLLILLLIPGITRPINGSLRWIFIGPISIQPSEIAKLILADIEQKK